MKTISKSPIYNLKVVVNETGVKPDTLRAWERRYGLPKPQRTEGGHRLYSDFDVELIRWLLARQDEGLSISRAVELWQKLEGEGSNPFQEMIGSDQGRDHSVEPIVGENLVEIRDEWVKACINFDEGTAEQIIMTAFARYPVETIVFEVLQKGLSEIGEMWYVGETSVQQEHFASALAARRLDAMIAAAPQPTRKENIMIACPPGEEHTFSSLVLNLVLRYRGFGVVYLGANVPLEQIENVLETIRPNLVVLTAMQLSTAAELLKLSNYIGRYDIPIAYGGLVFNQLPSIRKKIPGFYLGEKIASAESKIEEYLHYGGDVPKVEITGQEWMELEAAFNKNKSVIEAELWQRIERRGSDREYYSIALENIHKDISAALMFGDISLIEVNVEWIKGYIHNKNVPELYLAQFFTAYSDSILKVLGEPGRPLYELLAQVVREQ